MTVKTLNFIGSFSVCIGLMAVSISSIIQSKGICYHDWQEGPYWINMEGSYEEPKYYSPSSLRKADACTKCGMIRITPEKPSTPKK